jgi:hypothetical protein
VRTVSLLSVITGAAREHLRPLGLTQRSRSRLWLDDQEWFLIAVEFQPSGFSRSPYLNVGVMWLWDERDHVAFHVGHRVPDGGFEDYRSDEQFRPHAERMAHVAAQRVTAYRRTFETPKDAARFLVRETRVRPDDAFDAGCASALAGECVGAVRLLRQYAAARPPKRAEALALVAAGTGGVRDAVQQRIAHTRLLLGLVELPAG